MSTPQHLLIAGGGMVGMSLALLLDRAAPASLSITLVEGVALPSADTPSEPYHPSFDARSTALSYSTAEIYRRLDLWDELLPGLGPIRSIHVSRRGRPASTRLLAEEQGWDSLGWVVENPCLGRCLLAAVRRSPRLHVLCPRRVQSASAEPGGMCVRLDGDEEVRCDLLVIADGAESALRDRLGFLTRRKSYGQDALVTNLAFERDHLGCAYERFTASGPLALLPLPATAQADYRMALVWTLPPEDARELTAASEEDFSRALLDAFGERLGRVTRVGARHAYPLALTEAVEQARRGCVVLGNAAHALHPVAGQGFNLALRDAHALAEAVLTAGDAIGDTRHLNAYAADRSRDQEQTIFASDSLPALFMQSDPIFSLGRDLALAGLDLFPVLRREFVQQAAGMAALQSGNRGSLS
ncbi:MAG: 2-octaprenyl-6-methoxyphenyl hydroxylase [Pseudomonadota bacterium]